VLAETERGLITSGPQRLDLITAAVVETLRPRAAERSMRFDAELSPATVAGEAPLLERLVTNLVQNAIKYNLAEGGAVQVTVTPSCVLRVVNTGPRVAPDQVTGLFEPFRRASGERLDHAGGVGLGLTIVRSVVGAHRGTVTAEANPNGGLTVEVRLRP
jgi:signal transduction histidine kinase